MRRPLMHGLAQVAVLARAGVDVTGLLPEQPWPVVVEDDATGRTLHANGHCQHIGEEHHLGTVRLADLLPCHVRSIGPRPRREGPWLCDCAGGLGRPAPPAALGVLAQLTGILWLLEELLTLSGLDERCASFADPACNGRGTDPVPDYAGGRWLNPGSGPGWLATARLLLADLAATAPEAGTDTAGDQLAALSALWAAIEQAAAAVGERRARLAARLPAWAQALAERADTAVQSLVHEGPEGWVVTPAQRRKVADEETPLTALLHTMKAWLWRTPGAAPRPEWAGELLAEITDHPAVKTHIDQNGHRALVVPTLGFRLGTLVPAPADPDRAHPRRARDGEEARLLVQLRAGIARLDGPGLDQLRLIDVDVAGHHLPGTGATLDPTRLTALGASRIIGLFDRDRGPAGSETPRQSLVVAAPVTTVAALLAASPGLGQIVDLGPAAAGDSDEVLRLAADLWWSEPAGWDLPDGSAGMTALARSVLHQPAGEPARALV